MRLGGVAMRHTGAKRLGRGRLCVRSGLMDDVKRFFDEVAFENWAPRSSRTWRLGLPPRTTPRPDDPEKAKLWATLEREVGSFARQVEVEEESDDEGRDKFVPASDSDLTASLNDRIHGIADGDGDTEPQVPLTGGELRRLIFAKYSRTYDVAFARRDLWGKPIVSLNIMWNYLEQGSFPMDEDQLLEKYGRFAIYLNSWQQAERVRKFLTEPRKSKGGLPSRPIIGIAVSFQLDLPPHVISEWFDKN